MNKSQKEARETNIKVLARNYPRAAIASMESGAFNMTPQELAKAYADTINGPANGWGQHVHPTLGRSDFIMLKLSQKVGHDECQRLIIEAMKPNV